MCTSVCLQPLQDFGSEFVVADAIGGPGHATVHLWQGTSRRPLCSLCSAFLELDGEIESLLGSGLDKLLIVGLSQGLCHCPGSHGRDRRGEEIIDDLCRDSELGIVLGKSSCEELSSGCLLIPHVSEQMGLRAPAEDELKSPAAVTGRCRLEGHGLEGHGANLRGYGSLWESLS